MAWNKYYIFVKAHELPAINEILDKLFLSDYKPIKEVSLQQANKPDTLFTAIFDNTLLIVHPALPFHFFTDKPSAIERMFMDAFPKAEIAALLENKSEGLYGYSIIINGKKVRMKDGSDGDVYHDQGEQLKEEKEISSGDEKKKAEESMKIPDLITKRYLNEKLEKIDTEKIKLVMYEMSN